MSDYWNDEYNKQPEEVLKLGQIQWAKTMINGLNREKARIKTRNNQSLSEINSHIKNLEKLIPPPPVTKGRE